MCFFKRRVLLQVAADRLHLCFDADQACISVLMHGFCRYPPTATEIAYGNHQSPFFSALQRRHGNYLSVISNPGWFHH